jgi:hypothetical protein
LLWKILAQQAVSIFVCASLPWALRIAKVELNVGGNRDLFVLCHLRSSVPSQRLSQLDGQALDLLDQGADDCLSIFSIELYEHRKSGLTLHERGDMCIAGASDQIALPMPRDGSVFDRCRSFADRNCVNNSATWFALRGELLSVAHQAFGPQMLHQLFS